MLSVLMNIILLQKIANLLMLLYISIPFLYRVIKSYGRINIKLLHERITITLLYGSIIIMLLYGCIIIMLLYLSITITLLSRSIPNDLIHQNMSPTLSFSGLHQKPFIYRRNRTNSE